MNLVFTKSQIDRLKRDAQLLRRNEKISYAQALDAIAIRSGYENWSRLMLASRQQEEGKHPNANGPHAAIRDPGRNEQHRRASSR